MDVETFIRRISRNIEWQLKYRTAKELNIQLFDNRKNLSGIQLLVCHWLNTYNELYNLLSSGNSEYLDDEVIQNDLRLDCYFLLQKELNKIEKAKRIKDRIGSGLKKNHSNVSETYFYQKKKNKGDK